ncbi:hypothetical protein, partial [Candidatus Villigracilis affinis]|uniref:hypothetical protein n=1 Tax=Candidatus Villigracilis affinis TaxID=3140682 RepID=UPI0031EC6D4A
NSALPQELCIRQWIKPDAFDLKAESQNHKTTNKSQKLAIGIILRIPSSPSNQEPQKQLRSNKSLL